MNTFLIQQYAIIGADAAMNVAREIEEAYRSFVFNLNPDASLKESTLRFHELVSMFELLHAEQHGGSKLDLNVELDRLITTESDKKQFTDTIQGIRLAGSNSSRCKTVSDSMFRIAKCFCQVARFGVHTYDPNSSKLAMDSAYIHLFIAYEAMRSLFPGVDESYQDANNNMKALVASEMRLSEEGGML